ncbi:MAG: sugar phosphate isomerase/epimerase family protein [Planctomycetota bacterium]
MPSFGVCTSVDRAAVLQSVGFDHVEAAAVPLFDGRVADDSDLDIDAVRRAVLPVPACNMLLPGDDITITGPTFDLRRLTTYIDRTFRRAASVGVGILVFGSGAARPIRDGQTPERARERILTFLRTAAPLAELHGVTLAIEPLRSEECNIINTVSEAMEYVDEVDHPGVRCLVDSFHMWEEREPLASVEEAMGCVVHVHVADRGTRAGSGADPRRAGEYRDFFALLKGAGYDGAVSVEGKHRWDEDSLRTIHDFLHEQWNAA